MDLNATLDRYRSDHASLEQSKLKVYWFIQIFVINHLLHKAIRFEKGFSGTLRLPRISVEDSLCGLGYSLCGDKSYLVTTFASCFYSLLRLLFVGFTPWLLLFGSRLKFGPCFNASPSWSASLHAQLNVNFCYTPVSRIAFQFWLLLRLFEFPTIHMKCFALVIATFILR